MYKEEIYMKLNRLLQVVACLLMAGTFANVHADTQGEIKGINATSDDLKNTEGADGWTYSLKFSGTGGYAHHSHHLTETNGKTYSLGGKLDGAATWRMDSKEWRTSLLIDEGTQKNPNIDHFTKTSDLLKIESIYLWGLPDMPKFGPYVKGAFDTSIFKNDRFFSDDATVVGPNGVVTTDRVRLTDGLGDNPMTLKGSVGVFYKAIEEEHMNLVLNAGLGAMRVWANGFSMSYDKDTDLYTLAELKDFTDYGLVLGLDFRGKLDEKTSYQVGFESLTPFDKNEDDFPQLDDTDLIGATNYDAFAKIDTKLYDFLSLGYEFRIKKQPKLQKKEQISNLFGLSLTYIML